MTEHALYRYTSIGRPLEPAVPSNKAVLILLPLAFIGGAAAGFAGLEQGALNALRLGGISLLAAFGCWALGRELLPDDPIAAFVAMALGFLVSLASDAPGLLTLFTTLFLARIVNRTTGLKARVPDSLMVTGLVIWTVYATASPWFGAVGALAFLLDASLRRPLKRQLLYALLCAGSMVVYIVDYDVNWLTVITPGSLIQWLGVFALVLFSLNLVLMRKVHSRDDVHGERLPVERVKGAMVIGLLAALQGLDTMPDVVLLVATIGGLCLGIAFRRAFRSSAKGLRAA
ncbi:hypothetical protein [Elongatibacter sediminis]|uniref:Uncharacterized protein n=1 Tax=Elongatibacter sediminis TaxID=3119006 RepID=A0AAW9R6X7_9GAMM